MEKKEAAVGMTNKSEMKWKEVMIGGVSGIMLGSAGTFAATATPIDVTEDMVEENSDENVEEPADTIFAHGNVASGVTDDMSFSEAFAAARHEVGAGGCFVWHGNVYGTYYANEWSAMTPDQRDEFVASTIGVDTTSHNNQDYASNTTGTQTHQSAQPEEQVEEDDLTVEVLVVEQVQNEDGSVSNIGAASINGQAVYFIDVDGQDNQFDLMVADLNGNGQLDENEIIDITDQHMAVSQFTEIAQVSGNGTGSHDEVEQYYASNENLPDYVNDADPADLA